MRAKSLMKSSSGPLPFSWPASGFFDGNDGSWSTFIIRVGTPPQTFRVLPSTVGLETWVPAPEDCALLQLNDRDCGALRGVNAFNNQWSPGFMVNESSSWKYIGLYNLGLDNNLNYTGNGKFGLDTVGLEIPNSGGLTLKNQIVAGTGGLSFMLGIFGLGPTPTNFSDFNNPQPSYLWSLKNQSLIPSLSYGYSAGAVYRGKGVLGSLTLGGYDSSRFQPNNQTFTFSSTTSGATTIGLVSIQGTDTLNGSVKLLPTGIFTVIDATIPEIWLPVQACSLFESSFGLTYDAYTDRYLVNDSMHAQLQSLNPVVAFQLGNDISSNETIQITLPYAAFDLQASFPIYPNATQYFPLRRAANDSQYTLGRTFLQESYLTVDYERSTFKLSQSIFPTDISTKIIPIPPLPTSGPSKFKHSQLIGIIVGSIIAFLLILGAFAFILWRRKQKHKQRSKTQEQENEEKEPDKEITPDEALPPELPNHFSSSHEVHGSQRFSPELDSNAVNEMSAVFLYELPDDGVVPELAGKDAGTGVETCVEVAENT